MKTHRLAYLVPGIAAAPFLALALSAAAQTPAPEAQLENPQAAPMAECQAMMAKKQEMQDELQAMDVKLDELVAEMNAASTSEAPDAMEKPMAAVITELVAQRKATQSMMMEMQPEMMAHMMHHRGMHGTKGAMDCPMMKTDEDAEAAAEETKPGE